MNQNSRKSSIGNSNEQPYLGSPIEPTDPLKTLRKALVNFRLAFLSLKWFGKISLGTRLKAFDRLYIYGVTN